MIQPCQSSDEEKKEEGCDYNYDGGNERSISEQRRRRQRRRREATGGEDDSACQGGDRQETNRNYSPAASDSTTALVAAERGDNGDGDGGSDTSEQSEYATAYTAIRRKYPQHFGGPAQTMLNYQNYHRTERNSRRALGIKLIRRQWKSQIIGAPKPTPVQRRCRRRTVGNGAATNSARNNYMTDDVADDDVQHQPRSVQPMLVYRRANTDYSSSRHYQSIKFLNAQTILAVDSYGDLDIVGLPPSIHRKDADKNEGSGNSTNSGNDHGVGTHLITMPISPAINVGGPRCPISPAHVELYGYQNGNKFVVGLPSGQVQLFSSERIELCSDSSPCITQYSCNNDASAVWSCLPKLGPRRRYIRNDQLSLASMLSLDNKNTLLESINDFEEITGWDDGSSFSLKRYQGKDSSSNRLWAFREGGIGGGSGTALVGAFIDPELDCFSLRLIDERVGGGVLNANASSSSKVFVDISRHSAGNCTMGEKVTEDVKSICFSGEHGLVTNHAIINGNGTKHPVIKWWDHRMLRDQPLSAANLVFPRDSVSGVSSALEYSLKGCYCCGGEQCDGGKSCVCRPVSLLPSKQNSVASSPEYIEVMDLVGSNDSSDRFAVPLQSCGRLQEVLIIDSSSMKIVKRERSRGVPINSAVVPPCFSSNLDFMALHGKKLGSDQGDATECISFFDISRHHSCNKGLNNHDSYKSLHLGGKKRRVDCCFASEKENISGFIGSLHPECKDVYGISANLSCMAMDDFGCSIAFGTYDGDIFLLQGQ